MVSSSAAIRRIWILPRYANKFFCAHRRPIKTISKHYLSLSIISPARMRRFYSRSHYWPTLPARFPGCISALLSFFFRYTIPSWLLSMSQPWTIFPVVKSSSVSAKGIGITSSTLLVSINGSAGAGWLKDSSLSVSFGPAIPSHFTASFSISIK